jgi:lycopene cyclase domain-containing protein
VTYTAAAVLGVVAAVTVDLRVLRTGLVRRRVFWAAYPIVLGFQLLFNGVLTGRGVVVYAPRAILGPRLAHAPVEDLGFGFALVLTTLSMWMWLETRAAARAGEPAPAGDDRAEDAGRDDEGARQLG